MKRGRFQAVVDASWEVSDGLGRMWGRFAEASMGHYWSALGGHVQILGLYKAVAGIFLG